MTATSLPDQVREALAAVADDAHDRDIRLARIIETLADAIDDRAACKLRNLLR